MDAVSAFTGKAFAWLIVVLTGIICYDVAARYIFLAPTAWAFDGAYILYGSLFMMAGAYTLSRNGHVRGDVLYGFFPPRVPGRPGPGALRPVLSSASLPWPIRESTSLTSAGSSGSTPRPSPAAPAVPLRRP